MKTKDISVRKQHPEAEFQKSIVKWFRLTFPEYLIFSVPNESEYKNTAHWCSMGLLSGVSDLIIVIPNKVLFIECKSPTGKLREEQKKFRDKGKSLNQDYYVIRDKQDLISILKQHLYVDTWPDEFITTR